MLSGTDFSIQLDAMLVLQWGAAVEQEIVEIGPPEGSSFLELPGPKRRPVRPYLRAFVGGGGIVAHVVRGDGYASDTAVQIGPPWTTLQLTQSPLALSARTDNGIWALHEGKLVQYDRAGRVDRQLELSGVTLVGGEKNGVWVVGLDTASFVDGQGDVLGRYPWDHTFGSVGVDGRLCALSRDDPDHAVCLSPDGTESAAELPRAPSPHEQLLAMTANEVLTMSGNVLRRYRATGQVDELPLQSAGLAANGTPFLSGRADKKVDLWTGVNNYTNLVLPHDTPATGAFRVVAIQKERVMVYGLDRAMWYESGTLQEEIIVDDVSYRDEVFPYLWCLANTNAVAATAMGMPVLSVSGPQGMALIAVHWNPG